MSVLAVVRLAPLELEDDKLLTQVLGDDLAGDFGAFDERLAERKRRVADGQDLAKNNLGTWVTEKLFDLNDVACGDAKLMSAGANDCSCHGNGVAEASAGRERRKPQPDGLMARSGVSARGMDYLTYANCREIPESSLRTVTKFGLSASKYGTLKRRITSSHALRSSSP